MNHFPIRHMQFSMARSRTLPLVRNSWLINVMLFPLLPISICQFISKPHGPTTNTAPVTYLSGQVRQVQFSERPACTAPVLIPQARYPTAPNRVLISFTTLFLDSNAQRHIKHIVSQSISLVTKTYKHKSNCQSQYHMHLRLAHSNSALNALFTSMNGRYYECFLFVAQGDTLLSDISRIFF